MFCIKCGRPAKIGNFCDVCFLDSQELFDAKDFSAVYCNLCGIDEKAIKEAVEKAIKTKNAITSRNISLKLVGNKFYATITCSGKIRGLLKTESKKILILLNRKMCDTHVKLSGGYYEAVIQVRGKDKEKILKYATRSMPKKAISSIETLNEGYNIKVMRKANAAAAAKALRKNFDVKDSYKLVGSKKGQKLYRNFYAIR